jgi:alpha-galactosidase
MLLNLADPACNAWISTRILTLIRESGINWYRQDFNFDPLPYWRDNEAVDRKGMLENLYVQGYLKFWDYLLENQSGLKIDACASGGRRNDLETMRRSVPLHPSDYGYGYHYINQAFRRTLMKWIPYIRSWNNSWDIEGVYQDDSTGYYDFTEVPSIDNFKLINSFGVATWYPSLYDLTMFPDKADYVKLMFEIKDKLALIILWGDYYSLTEDYRDHDHWTVYQYNYPDNGTGAFQILRNLTSAEETLTVYPRDLVEGANYVLVNQETGETRTMNGTVMTDGVTFSLSDPRSGAIWFYQKQ